MAITGFLGQPISWNTNTWFSKFTGIPTPETQLTERIQGPTAPMNYQGGSTLRNTTPAEYLTPGFQSAEQLQTQQPNSVTRSTLGTSPTAGASTVPSGKTLGASTTKGTEPAPTGPSPEDQLRSEVDAIFSPVMNLLNSQEGTLRENYASVPGAIENQYQTAYSSLGTEKASGENQIAQQEKGVGGAKENALTAATRLYNELNRGGMQRFGGASSAGEAFQTLTAQEQQRRQGTIYSEYATAMDKIGGYKADLEGKYSTALAQLNTQKQSALGQARSDFQDALSAIQTNIATAESDRATATLNTLQDYRNKVYTINAEALSFAQQLALNNQTSLSYVDQATKQLLAAVNGAGTTATSATNTLSQAPTTAYGTSAGNTPGVVTPTGIATTTAKKYDIYGNEIA